MIRYLLAPFRRHRYDFENVQLKHKEHPEGQEKALLYFVAICVHCGKEITVDRETFISIDNDQFKPTLFCVRDPVKFKKWRELREERREYLRPSPLLDDPLFTEDQEPLDIRHKNE